MQAHENVMIDPIAMNITNRISAGSKSSGSLLVASGILIEGEHHGDIAVRNGPLVLVEGAHITGKINVEGDAYIFGIIGETVTDATETTMIVTGTLHLASKSVAYGKLSCGKMALYQGAKVHGAIDTIDHSITE